MIYVSFFSISRMLHTLLERYCLLQVVRASVQIEDITISENSSGFKGRKEIKPFLLNIHKNCENKFL